MSRDTDYLVDRLVSDKEFRDAYWDAHLSEGLASQIRATREERRWTQRELGEHAGGKAQSVISQLEDPDYGRYSLSTLKRIASAFDVALVVRFVPYSHLLDYTSNLSLSDVAVLPIDRDRALRPGPAGRRARSRSLDSSFHAPF